MKTSVESVLVSVNGTTYPVGIRTENGDLKYHFLLKLYQEGRLVMNGSATTALYEMGCAYAELSAKTKSKRRIAKTVVGAKEPKEENEAGVSPVPVPYCDSLFDDLRLEQEELH